ncbi:hypothetical protein MPER_04463, partial [Moniliophthora perniciosa FA553]
LCIPSYDERCLDSQNESTRAFGCMERAIESGMRAKVALEDELKKGCRDHTDHIKRTHDYEPFLTEFITCLHAQGLVDALVNKPKKPGAKSKANGKVNGKPTTRKRAKVDQGEIEDGNWKP